jgi:folate-binding protein YgfZ
MLYHLLRPVPGSIFEPMQLMLPEFHKGLGARGGELNGAEVVAEYGDYPAEHAALHQSAGFLDLSFRSRLCLAGADRARFLHGQVTNDVNKLRPGQGCYAAITTAKGKMESDVNILCLTDELLLDFEPGLSDRVSQRLEKYLVADDVQIVDVRPHYGLLSVQGPKSEEAIRALNLFDQIPAQPLASIRATDATLGEVYLARNARLGGTGFDVFVPAATMGAVANELVAAVKQLDGRPCGWQAFETARIETGIPRFGADMDETNIPLECGIESRAITYTKGCYIGQEVINRIHSVGHVNRSLHGLRLEDTLKAPPQRGDKLFHEGKEVGYLTSAVNSPHFKANIALGYVRREAGQIGTELLLNTSDGDTRARIVELPFR